MRSTSRRWLIYATAGTISTALGAAINIATNLMANPWAWTGVGVLTVAGIIVGAGVDRATRVTGDGASPVTVDSSTGSAHAEKGNAFVLNFSGGRNRVKVVSNRGSTLVLVGLTIFLSGAAGMWAGSGIGANQGDGGEQVPAALPSSAPTPSAAAPPSADRTGGSCLIEDDPQTTEQVPFTCTVEQLDWSCGRDTWITTKSPEEIAEPMPLEAKSDGWRKWPAVADGVAGSGGKYQLIIQGKGSAAVVLTGVTVRVLDRRPPVNGYALGRPCGGDGVFRTLDVDLDRTPPTLTPTFRPERAANPPYFELKPIRFPYTVAFDDAESFLVAGYTSECDCDWELELRWASQGATGKVAISDNGIPFRTTSPTGSRRCTVEEYIECR